MSSLFAPFLVFFLALNAGAAIPEGWENKFYHGCSLVLDPLVGSLIVGRDTNLSRLLSRAAYFYRDKPAPRRYYHSGDPLYIYQVGTLFTNSPYLIYRPGNIYLDVIKRGGLFNRGLFNTGNQFFVRVSAYDFENKTQSIVYPLAESGLQFLIENRDPNEQDLPALEDLTRRALADIPVTILNSLEKKLIAIAKRGKDLGMLAVDAYTGSPAEFGAPYVRVLYSNPEMPTQRTAFFICNASEIVILLRQTTEGSLKFRVFKLDHNEYMNMPQNAFSFSALWKKGSTPTQENFTYSLPP